MRLAIPRPVRSKDQVQHDLQLAINLALSCWSRMEADQREMALRLASNFENHEGYVDLDWRKELRKDDDDDCTTVA